MSLSDISSKYGLEREATSNRYYGCIDGEDQYTHFIDDLKSLGVAFATRTSRSYQADSVVFKLRSHGADHELGIDTSALLPYDGMPFYVEKTTYQTCVQGWAYKKLDMPSRSPTDDHSCTKKRFWARPTKKIECPAKMTVRCLRVFNEDCYRAKAPNYNPGSYEIRKILRKLKQDLKAGSSAPTGMLRFMIVMSSHEEHNHTTVSAKLNGIIHPHLLKEIQKFVGNNICSTKTMKIHLEEVVRNMFEDGDRPKPDRLNRCYYPNDQAIRFHMYSALYNIKQSRFDQDGLEACIKTWQAQYPDDKFRFRPYKLPAGNEDEDDEPTCSTLLFCHQTKWQQDLLARYGNNISLLDATYKTTKYDLPLFFIVVKTNSGYCVVGTFVVQSESCMLIAEALSQFKTWNHAWQPKYFMTDYSEAEINALEETFPESTVYLCAFHREQSWNRWLMKTGNVSKDAIAPLKRLWRDIAASNTEEEYEQNVKKMYDDPFYQDNPHAHRYFTREWLPVYYRWVSAYHAKDFLSKVNTNNGIESQNKVLKHKYLKQNKDNTLTGLIMLIIKYFLPEAIRSYSVCNAMINSNYKKYSSALPEFLNNRPMSFIQHVKERFEKGKEYDLSHIHDMGEGLFFVRSELDKDEWYKVDFHEPTCLCFDFSKWRFPCKHMCAIFIHTEWGFDKLPQCYRENPYITVDLQYTAGIGASEEPETTDHQQTSITDSCDTQTLRSEEPETTYQQPLSNEDGGLENQEKLRLRIQKKIKLISNYSYLDFTPEHLQEVAKMIDQVEERMKSLVTKSNEGLLLAPLTAKTTTQQLKNTKQCHSDLPKRNRLKLKTKFVGRAGVAADMWRSSAATQYDFGIESVENSNVEVEYIV